MSQSQRTTSNALRRHDDTLDPNAQRQPPVSERRHMGMIVEDKYYYGSPWSVTNFRDGGVAQRLLGVDPSKWTDDHLDDQMRQYYAKQLPGSGFLTEAAIYSDDKEIHKAYWDFVADMTKIRDDLVIIVFVLDIRPESQCEPNPWPAQYRFPGFKELVETSLGPPRWWKACTTDPRTPMSECTPWYNPRTGKYIEERFNIQVREEQAEDERNAKSELNAEN